MENGKKKFSDWSSSFEKNIIKQDRVITDDSSMITLVALSDLELKIIGALIFHSPKNTRWCRKWVKKTDISIASHVSDIPTKFLSGNGNLDLLLPFLLNFVYMSIDSSTLPLGVRK